MESVEGLQLPGKAWIVNRHYFWPISAGSTVRLPTPTSTSGSSTAFLQLPAHSLWESGCAKRALLSKYQGPMHQSLPAVSDVEVQTKRQAAIVVTLPPPVTRPSLLTKETVRGHKMPVLFTQPPFFSFFPLGTRH